ncbi:hypothetical protein GC176_28400 [bacterium]|nr:hypothetical protein [bacterium]
MKPFTHKLTGWFAASALLAGSCGPLAAQDAAQPAAGAGSAASLESRGPEPRRLSPAGDSSYDLAREVEQLSAEVSRLQKLIDSDDDGGVQLIPDAVFDSGIQPTFYQVEERPEDPYQISPLYPEEVPIAPSTTVSDHHFESGYDRGFYIRPTANHKEENPFDLKISSRLDFRHSGTKSDNPMLPSQNEFELERARIKFNGHAFSEKMEYEIQLRFDNDSATNVRIFDYYTRYEFSDAFAVQIGQAKVPFARAWVESSSRLQVSDRSMASNFFMPQRSQGVWFSGEPCHQLYYQAAVLNGYDTTSLAPSGIDTNFLYAGTVFWDPFDDFGSGFSDLQDHQNLAVRMGSSGAYEHVSGSSAEPAQMRIVGSGATIGNTIATAYAGDSFNHYAYAADIAMKYRGFSLFNEYYFRWLQDFTGPTAAPSKIYDWGFVLQGGYFVVPKKLELFARHSQIRGTGGAHTAFENSGGFNWFLDGHYMKLTFDVSTYNGSPSVSSSMNLRQGEDGTLFRSQFQWVF